MDQFLNKSFDFSIRIMELAKYLDEERKLYPSKQSVAYLCGRNRSKSTGFGIYPRGADEWYRQALSCAVESEYLLETMVKMDCLQEKQSVPILSDCRSLKELIAEQLLLKKQNN
ncbi:MAG: hypothetical protein VB084_11815 [Syntrophomonadaceae bacterium]|nr:hypothetical protein [Syntrophomonadaceae bacterium]